MKSYHKDEKRGKTKERAKSVKYYEQLRQNELERQCEEFYMSLDCKEKEWDTYEEDEEWDVLTPSLVEEHEEVVDKEPESKVWVEETESLKDSPLNVSRKGGNVAGMLLCSCQGCRKEFHNKEVEETLNLELGQPLRLFGKDKMLGSNKEQQDNGSYFSSCPEIQNLLLCYSYCGLENSLVEGINHNSFTPHFHYYMLLWLMISLEHLHMVTHCFEWSCRVVCLGYYELPSFEKLCYDEYLRVIRPDFTEFYGFIMNMSISEIFVLIITKWKLFNDGEINQVPPCCPDFELKGLRYKFGVDHCETCLRMYFLISLSSTSSSHDSRGVVSHLRVVFDEKGAPKQQGQTHCIHMWLNVSDYMFFLIIYRVFVVEVGLKQPWMFGMGGMSPIERDLVGIFEKVPFGSDLIKVTTYIGVLMRFFLNHVEQPEVLLGELFARACGSSLSITEHHELSKDGNQMIIMPFDPGDKEEQSIYHTNLNHSETQCSGFADSIVIRIRHFIMIFDPGGGCVNH